uniref:Uncharacterized protein n=1 Tax=Arundo donax TaxID=35708 RepID=A0A0A9BTD3_ARUDO
MKRTGCLLMSGPQSTQLEIIRSIVFIFRCPFRDYGGALWIESKLNRRGKGCLSMSPICAVYCCCEATVSV